MSTKPSDPPRFYTRQEAANLLRITPRQIDRLAAEGVLEKWKLSASRSGFERVAVDAHLERGRGGASTSASDGAPTSAPNKDSLAYVFATVVRGITLEGAAVIGGALIDEVLGVNFPAVTVTEDGDDILLIWPARVGYKRDDVFWALVKGLESDARLVRGSVVTERAKVSNS